MTDHVKNQLCQRIEELEAEKMELNEQLDIAQQERDVSVAHVERLTEALKHLRHNAYHSGAEMGLALEVADDALIGAPTTSLSRIKAQWQAEALEELAEVPKKWWPGELLIEANKLRRQAEGGEA